MALLRLHLLLLPPPTFCLRARKRTSTHIHLGRRPRGRDVEIKDIHR
jgi:hypothetical protein